MQTTRPGRAWWRLLLDQYGAADVVVPEVHFEAPLSRRPAIGTFTARSAPTTGFSTVTLRVGNCAAIPALLDEGVRRLDASYTRALEFGILVPDPSLIIEEPEVLEDAAEKIEAANEGAPLPAAPSTANIPVPVGAATSFSIQVDTPTAGAIQQAEISVSRIPGITSALTVNPAAGGTSVMRVTYVGDADRLAAALQAQGWSVQGGGSTLRISRPGAAAPEGE
jgi:hypothetical protein